MYNIYFLLGGFPGESVVKNLPAEAGDTGDMDLIPGLGRSPGENGNPLQYSCLENLMIRGTCRLQSMESQRVRNDWSHKELEMT